MPLSFKHLALPAAALMALTGGAAQAQTLNEALAQAYENNPTITAARSGQRATDENVPIARSDALPNLGASAGLSQQLWNSGGAVTPDRTLSLRTDLSVPIYQGGLVRNSIRAAEVRVDVGQANLRGVESGVFSQVVAAYMDVLRDEAVVALNRNNVEVLSVNLTATRDRFDIGDLTRTDVAQSESRLAIARSQLQAVEARLIASRENYVRLVGSVPVNLQAPPPLPGLPAAVDVAVETALAENPDLEAAQNNVIASGFDVRALRGLRMPRLSATASGSHTDFLADGVGHTGGGTVGLAVTVPLYQGGEPAARVRQAQARESLALEQAIGVERSVIAQTRSAFASWRAANAVIESSLVAVQASQLSLEGVRAENSVGTRTILDILNAEQELLNAQVQLVTARRDAYVAGFTMLAAMGRAEAEDLGLGGGALYDPDANYQRVRARMWDWGDDPDPAAVATRTRGTVPQNATLPDGNTPDLARP